MLKKNLINFFSKIILLNISYLDLLQSMAKNYVL